MAMGAFMTSKPWVAWAWALLLVGCAVPSASVSTRDVDSPATNVPQATQGLAELYVFNLSGWTLIPSNQDVTDNGQLLVSLSRLTYKKAFISSGVHDLRLHGRKLIMHAERGETYFVVVGYLPERSWALPLLGDPVVIRQVTREEARPLLEKLTAQ